MIFRPLFYNFPQDPYMHNYGCEGHQSIQEQFMIGKGLMVVPVLAPNIVRVEAYFPLHSRWYDLDSLMEVTAFEEQSTGSKERKRFQWVDTPLLRPIPSFLRGGFILFKQPVEELMMKSIYDLDNHVNLYIGLDELGNAAGEIVD